MAIKNGIFIDADFAIRLADVRYVYIVENEIGYELVFVFNDNTKTETDEEYYYIDAKNRLDEIVKYLTAKSEEHVPLDTV